jgi:hypothetical protein
MNKSVDIEAKDPFQVEYTVTKGALDPSLFPQEQAILSGKEEHLERW